MKASPNINIPSHTLQKESENEGPFFSFTVPFKPKLGPFLVLVGFLDYGKPGLATVRTSKKW